MKTLSIPVAGAVWLDFLDPDCSGMEAELGLLPHRDVPFSRKVGKGVQYVYVNVPAEIALDLARYLIDRGDTLLGQGVDDPYDPFEKATRAMLRRAVALGREIEGQAR